MPESEPRAVKRMDLLKEPYIGKEVVYHCHRGILGRHKDLEIPVVLDHDMQLSIASGDCIEIEGVCYIVRSEGQSGGAYEPMSIGDTEELLIVDDIPTEELRLKDDTARLELERIRKESERRRKAMMEEDYGEEAP